jgi:DNA-binding MarR family transcriptional regulator
MMIDFGALNRIGRDIRKGFIPTVNIKLKNREVHLLSMIQKHPKEPFIFYAERLGLERSSFSYIAENLELKGLIIRKNSMDDKRVKYLTLSETGIALTDDIERQFQLYLENLLSVLSKKEVTKLDQAVEAIKAIMSKVNI